MITALQKAYGWHRPLSTAAALMLLSTLISLAGIVLDPREILGAPAWAKPLKFSLSILLYTVTWAWLIAHLPRWHRLTHALGSVIAVTLAIEQVLIVWAAASGTTSHFNVSTGVHTAVWATMATAITIMYLCTLITSAAVFFMRLPTAALTAAVRAGALIALAGIGVAFLMTAPTADQLSSPSGIAGAHAVGVADGGPGLPLLGWSTEGGDYRVAHFIGMHALQLLPLLALILNAAARRLPLLRPPEVQLRLVITASAAYTASVALFTAQAAVGQSAARPDYLFFAAGSTILLTLGIAAPCIISRNAKSPQERRTRQTSTRESMTD